MKWLLNFVLFLISTMSLFSQISISPPNRNLFNSRFQDKMVVRFNSSGNLCETIQYTDGSIELKELKYEYIRNEKLYIFPPYTWICFPNGVILIEKTIFFTSCPTHLEPGIYDMINDNVSDVTTYDFLDFCTPPIVQGFDKERCTFNGKTLTGKVRVVEYGEDFKVRVVEYGEDITVIKQTLLSSSPKCGAWQFVEQGENFKVRIVEYREDFSIRFSDY